jgi:hypothetical protein
MFTYALTANTMILRSDGTYIPPDPHNADYVAYEAWIAAGNTPTSYVAPPPAVAPVIAQSAQSLQLANAKTLAAQGDTAGALTALLQIIEGNLTS